MVQLAAIGLPSNERQSLIQQVQVLATHLAEVIRAGHIDEAREIAGKCALPPLAWGYLAARLQKNGVDSEIIEAILASEDEL